VTDLKQDLAAAGKLVTVGARYRHYKGGEYQVLQLALLEATTEPCVVYQAQYGDRLSFIRPLTNWLQSVESDGRRIQRFTKLVQ